MKIVKPFVQLLAISQYPAQLIEAAGRTCYKSEDQITPDSAKKFVEMIKKRGHESVIEHAFASFRVVCDRGVTHEIVRHRLCSYSQESTRYCNYSKEKFGGEITVIEPPGLVGMDRTIWEKAMIQAELAYLALVSGGVKPEIARSVLPTCLKTEIVWTANFREWVHILKLRTSERAHPQMREIALEIQQTLRFHCPEVFGISVKEVSG